MVVGEEGDPVWRGPEHIWSGVRSLVTPGEELQVHKSWRHLQPVDEIECPGCCLGLRARCRFKGLIEAFWQLWPQQGKHHLSPATCCDNASTVPWAGPKVPSFLAVCGARNSLQEKLALPCPTASSLKGSGSNKVPPAQEAPIVPAQVRQVWGIGSR